MNFILLCFIIYIICYEVFFCSWGGGMYIYNYSCCLAKSNHANTHDLDTDDRLQFAYQNLWTDCLGASIITNNIDNVNSICSDSLSF